MDFPLIYLMTCVNSTKFIILYICLLYSLILLAEAELCGIINSQAKELEGMCKKLDNTLFSTTISNWSLILVFVRKILISFEMFLP